MATFKEISAADIKTSRSALNQLVDIIQEDVSGSITRKSYEVFVTGGVGPGVTSSLFQTVYDQDFTLQSANAIFDISIGINPGGTIVEEASTGEDSSGKKLYSSQSLMMREKTYIYKQFAQTLLGDADAVFTAPFGDGESSNEIECAMFLGFKRLFARDKIKRETFAIRFYQSASISGNSHNWLIDPEENPDGLDPDYYGHEDETLIPSAWDQVSDNIFSTSTGSVAIYTDIGSSTSKRTTFGGEVGNIVNSYNTEETVGTLFYDAGVAVLDLNKMWQGDQPCMGVIDAMNNVEHEWLGVTGGMSGAAISIPCGKIGMGYGPTLGNTTFYPDFLVSASMDNVIDHLASARFQSGTLTAMTFQNITNINSTLIFCRATADEFNYSSNPTYVDNEDRVVVIDEGQEDTQRSFTFPTTVGLYDANDNLLAVAKMSRPIEKNDEKDITVRVRLDF